MPPHESVIKFPYKNYESRVQRYEIILNQQSRIENLFGKHYKATAFSIPQATLRSITLFAVMLK